MSEEEVIKILKGYSAKNKECLSCAVPNREACELNGSDCIDEAIQALLDLYYKEKEERQKLKVCCEEQLKEADDILIKKEFIDNFNGTNKEQTYYFNGYKDATLFLKQLLEE